MHIYNSCKDKKHKAQECLSVYKDNRYMYMLVVMLYEYLVFYVITFLLYSTKCCQGSSICCLIKYCKIVNNSVYYIKSVSSFV